MPTALSEILDRLIADAQERELRALEAAMAEHELGTALVVTLLEEDTVELPGGPVRVVPAWRWLLEEGQETSRVVLLFRIDMSVEREIHRRGGRP